MSFWKYGIFNLSDAVGILHMKRSKKEYENIVGESNFFYTLGYKKGTEPIEFELTGLGHKEIVKASKAKMTTASAISVGEARGHG